ncbi:MAG: PASTA domain-containing protein [Gammaproteobacteria bacterium]|nr:PASTA domain-containing protein [Gammaproteobacteria bacterium]
MTAALAACGGGSGGGNNAVSVPNVVGSTQAAATTSITGAGLTLGTVTMQSSATVASGDVISENPAAGASATKGSSVALVVSSGPPPVSVPNVVGNTQAAATTAITGAGLTLGAVTMQSSATVASGTVISENPAAGTSVASGSSVALVVSSGPPPGNVNVPNVVGSTQAAATTSITGAGLVLGAVTQQTSATVVAGDVISENPAAGTSVPSGSAVALVVSFGPPANVNVPNVVGNTQAVATAAITGAGLVVGIVTQQSSATVASGNVISENPVAGTSVASGSAVALVVSSGPATTVTLGGEVQGLASGTVHVLNGNDNLALTANGSFTLPTAITSGSTYSVTIGSPQPTGQTCAVNNATGTAAAANITNLSVYCTTNVTTATLTGAYTVVNDKLAAQADVLTNASFDGVGTLSGTDTIDTNGVITTGTTSNSYSINTFTNAPVNTVPYFSGNGGQAEGALEFNASTVAVVTNALGGSGSGGLPGFAVGVKQIQNATVNTPNGTYTAVTMESTTPPSSSLYIGANSYTFNGGTVTTSGQSQRNTNGTIAPGPTAASSGSYTVSSSGIATIGNGNGLTGAIGPDGDLIIGAPITANGNGGTAGVYLLVKQGTGVTAATINGVYSMTYLSAGATASVLDGRAYFVTMSNGTFSGVYDENNSGTASTHNATSGTYTLASDGTMGLVTGGQTFTGTVSADGHVFVLADMTSGEAPTVILGIRQ